MPEPHKKRKIEQLVPRIVEKHRAVITELAETLTTTANIHRARTILKDRYGPVRARPVRDYVSLEIQHGSLEAAVL